MTAVRAGVGVCDVSTLGKIELEGPDVGAFLDRVYTNTFSTLPVGKARYGLMLREDGFVHGRRHDARLAADATSCRPPPRMPARVHAASGILPSGAVAGTRRADRSVTEQWAQFAIAGPRSRDVLQSRDRRASISPTRPSRIMAARELTVRRLTGAAVPHLVLRRARLRDRAFRRATAMRRSAP